MTQYRVYDRLSSSKYIGFLCLITNNKDAVDKLVADWEWRYEVITEEDE